MLSSRPRAGLTRAKAVQKKNLVCFALFSVVSISASLSSVFAPASLVVSAWNCAYVVNTEDKHALTHPNTFCRCNLSAVHSRPRHLARTLEWAQDAFAHATKCLSKIYITRPHSRDGGRCGHTYSRLRVRPQGILPRSLPSSPICVVRGGKCLPVLMCSSYTVLSV